MNSPNSAVKPPIDSAEIDSVIYQIADMLKTLTKDEIQKTIITLKDTLTFKYIRNLSYGDLLIVYSAAPFSDNDNRKFRELLTTLVQILNNIMPNLITQKRIHLINYIINTISNNALS